MLVISKISEFLKFISSGVKWIGTYQILLEIYVQSNVNMMDFYLSFSLVDLACLFFLNAKSDLEEDFGNVLHHPHMQCTQKFQFSIHVWPPPICTFALWGKGSWRRWNAKNSSHFPTCPAIIMFKFKDITKFSSFTFTVVDKDIIYF